MEQLHLPNGEHPEPWQVFDMIGGTSTGGLIALMVGRLRMPIAECEDAFAEFSNAIFTPRRHSYDPLRALDFVNANGKFDVQPLERLVKSKVVSKNLTEDALLQDNAQDSCKVYVKCHEPHPLFKL
jgi:patatin-like phospholipase/acyl hydrolase